MKDRKKTKTARLDEEHKVEMAQELRRQQLERDRVTQQLNEQIEQQLLGDALKGKSRADVEDVMYALLRQRHIKEAVHLEGQLDKEKDAQLAEARAEVVETRATEREKLQTAFDQVNDTGCLSIFVTCAANAARDVHDLYVNLVVLGTCS